MFCPQCGSKQPDAAQFCSQCGAALATPTAPAEPATDAAEVTAEMTEPATVMPEAEAAAEAPASEADAGGESEATTTAPTPAPAPGAAAETAAGTTPVPEPIPDAGTTTADTGTPSTSERPKRKSHRTAIIAGAIAAALVCGGGIGGFMWWQGEQARIAEEARAEAEAQAAYEAAHQTYPVAIKIQCDGLDTSTGTKIPLHVTGTDFEGNEFDETFYTDQNGTGVELMRGEYMFEVPASPIAADGTIYDVDAPGASGLGGTVHDGGSFETQNMLMLNPIPAEEVTDEEIDAAYDAAVEGGCENADGLRDAAIARRDEAVERQSSGSFEAASFSFSIPEQWIGRVDVTIDGDTATITPSDQPNHELCTLEIYEGQLNAGDISASTLIACDLGGDRSVTIHIPNYCYIIPQALASNSTNPDDFYTQAEAEELIDLQTLGAHTYDEAVEAWDSNPVTGITGAVNPMFDFFSSSVTAK